MTLDENNCVTSMKMDSGGAEVEDVVKLRDKCNKYSKCHDS